LHLHLLVGTDPSASIPPLKFNQVSFAALNFDPSPLIATTNVRFGHFCDDLPKEILPKKFRTTLLYVSLFYAASASI
jgi:hypothetical protein